MTSEIGPTSNPETQPWDRLLVESEESGSLVAIGREHRLMRQTRSGSVRVRLSTVDETVLALVDLALEHRCNITVVYPAPAGEVSVLLAGEILLRRFVNKEKSQSVGIVTSDTVSASRIWDQLKITTVGAQPRISEVFPCYRAGPNGESPMGRREFRGALIGGRFDDWPVDVVIVDHLAGPVDADPAIPTVRIFANPREPELARLADNGELIWGWTEEDLAALLEVAEEDQRSTVPFSTAADRLTTMAGGVKTTIHVVHQPDAENIVKRLRDDLHTLRHFAGETPSPSIMKGIGVAGYHMSTLISLPCKPSEFDRFTGIPPFAARATRTFEPEIAAWATTLDGDLREIADITASDMGDLRAELEHTNPFEGELSVAIADPGTLIVLNTHTAVRAFLDTHKAVAGVAGTARVVAQNRLHREGTWPRVIVVGTPAPWAWHRFDSGLSPDVHVLVLGSMDVRLGCKALRELHEARARFGCPEMRSRVWQELNGCVPPNAPILPSVENEVLVIDALEAEPEIDPFEGLQQLLISVPLIIGDEGIEESIAEQTPNATWQGAVDAVEITTNVGSILLPRTRLVDVRKDDEIITCRAEALASGMYLIVDRRGGRLGLLEALSERLKQERPDLLVANILIKDLRVSISSAFAASGMTHSELFSRLCSVGFAKTQHTASSYVLEDGPIAPRDFSDLKRLSEVLELEMSERKLREIFAGVQKWRGFRRAAGKALVAASRTSIESEGALRVDDETGLSLADLRDLVLEAEVLEVRDCPEPVPLTQVGSLNEV